MATTAPPFALSRATVEDMVEMVDLEYECFPPFVRLATTTTFPLPIHPISFPVPFPPHPPHSPFKVTNVTPSDPQSRNGHLLPRP